MSLATAAALFKIVVRIIAALQQTQWYRDGRYAAYAEMDAEQKRRVAQADQARADADALNVGDRLRDDDGHKRD